MSVELIEVYRRSRLRQGIFDLGTEVFAEFYSQIASSLPEAGFVLFSA